MKRQSKVFHVYILLTQLSSVRVTQSLLFQVQQYRPAPSPTPQVVLRSRPQQQQEFRRPQQQQQQQQGQRYKYPLQQLTVS